MYLYCISNRSARLSTKVVKVVHPFDGSPLGHHHLLSTNVASVAIKRKHLEDENEELASAMATEMLDAEKLSEV